jgi:hypothetical protein
MNPRLARGLADLLRGRAVPWREMSIGREADFIVACDMEDLSVLVHRRVSSLPEASGWPLTLREALEREAAAEAARELLRRRELVSVLAALGAEGIHPILLKGAALAYTAYDTPSLRPRTDTDLMVGREQVEATQRVMAGLGYLKPPYSDGDVLFCQFPLEKAGQLGARHLFDFHWKISTQPIFADLLTQGELASDAVPVPALGPHARAAGPVHALLLACIHPVMHHQAAERLLWTYDLHLLASQLAEVDFERLVEVAAAKHVASVCAHELALATSRFGTVVPDGVTRALSSVRTAEPSAVYLRRDRRWHNELISSLGALRWTDRLRLLREVALPGPRYMLQSYGVTRKYGAILLPALYLHRGLRGVWKVLTGRK